MKKFNVFIIALLITVLLVGCATKKETDGNETTKKTTKNTTAKKTTKETEKVTKREMEQLIILTRGSGVKASQVIQSQLKKAGIPAEIVEKKDLATFNEALDAGQFDIYVTGWRTGTGDADYALMNLFHSTGANNKVALNDADIDSALEAGRTQEFMSNEFINSYKTVEQILNEKAYIAPLYSQKQFVAHSTDVEGIELPLTSPPMYNKISWTSGSGKDNSSDPVIIGFARVNLISFDPIKENNIESAKINVNQYEGLVNISLGNEEITPGLATAWYSNDQQNYYFVIREGVKFSDGSDITGDDIAFSLTRAGDATISGNRGHSVHSIYKTVESINSTDVPADIASELEKMYGKKIDGKTVIKITTENPFSALLNKLTHHTGGIVKKAQVEGNEDYGMVDQPDLLIASGPYIVQELNKQTNELILVKNPHYYEPALLEQITLKIITEKPASVLALQAGDIQVTDNMPVDQVTKLEEDSTINMMINDSVLVRYLAYNHGKGENKPTFDEDLRKAIYYAINPEEVLFIVNAGYGAYDINSTLTPLIDTGFKRDSHNLELAKEYLDKYLAK